MKINKIIIGLCALLSFASCSDFLDVKDESAINPSIWDNEESAKLYLNNIYNACMVPFGGEDLVSSLANLSDETSDMGSSILLGTLGASDVGTYKVNTYEPIRYINIAFEAMKTSKLTPAEKNRILGQLYFLRAWQHWKLINLYGGVPYMRDYVTFTSPDSLTNAKRNKTSDCIKFLKEDLDSAIAKLPTAWDINKEYSRITRAAAASFKGRVLLFYASPQFNPEHNMDRWKDAYDANVLANSLCIQDGYELMSVVAPVTKEWPYGYDFNQIFTKKKSEGNKEVLIVTPYASDIKTHGYENSVCPAEFTTGTGAPSLCPVWDLVIAFPMKDGSLAFKYNPTVKNTRTFIGNGSDATKFYLNRDPRFYSTVAFNGGYYQLEGNGSRRQWTYNCPKKTTSGIITYYSENVAFERTTPTGFFCRKMVNPSILRANMVKSTTDWIEMRYAEVLLNLAECAFEYEGTNSTLGYDCLKQIRSRAGIEAGADGFYGLKSSTEISPIELVMNERRVELAFEGKRFYDLRRRNMFTADLGSYIYKLNGWKKSGSGFIFTLKNPSDTAIFLYPAKRDTISQGNLYKYFTMTGKSTGPLVKAIAYVCVPDSATLKTTNTGNYNFFGIPQDILTRSPAIKQNFGWQNGSFNPFE
ncbi:MAG TPA: RagB/SusD family nutrient uptake outer membrane protein [Paludibacter sp.]